MKLGMTQNTYYPIKIIIVTCIKDLSFKTKRLYYTLPQANEWPVREPNWPLSTNCHFANSQILFYLCSVGLLMCLNRGEMMFYCKRNPWCEVATVVRLATRSLGADLDFQHRVKVYTCFPEIKQ